MNFLKKQKVSFFIYLVVLLMTISLLFLYISNVNKPYYQDMRVDVIFLLVGTLLTILLSLGISLFSKVKSMFLVADISRIIAALLIILGGVTFISMRLESFGYIFGSNLEMGNDAAFDAGTQAIMIIILFMVTWLLAVIAAFFDIGQKKSVAA